MLLQGKIFDCQKEYNKALLIYQRTLEKFQQYQQSVLYSENYSEQQIKHDLGNIQFRLGWAIIRSTKNIEKGLITLKQADLNLNNNLDLKLKIAQILLQEKGDIEESTKYIKQCLEMKSDDTQSLLLYGKVLLKQKDSKLAADYIKQALEILEGNDQPDDQQLISQAYFHF